MNKKTIKLDKFESENFRAEYFKDDEEFMKILTDTSTEIDKSKIKKPDSEKEEMLYYELINEIYPIPTEASVNKTLREPATSSSFKPYNIEKIKQLIYDGAPVKRFMLGGSTPINTNFLDLNPDNIWGLLDSNPWNKNASKVNKPRVYIGKDNDSYPLYKYVGAPYLEFVREHQDDAVKVAKLLLTGEIPDTEYPGTIPETSLDLLTTFPVLKHFEPGLKNKLSKLYVNMKGLKRLPEHIERYNNSGGIHLEPIEYHVQRKFDECSYYKSKEDENRNFINTARTSLTHEQFHKEKAEFRRFFTGQLPDRPMPDPDSPDTYRFPKYESKGK